jgi:hypothetical protein
MMIIALTYKATNKITYFKYTLRSEKGKIFIKVKNCLIT